MNLTLRQLRIFTTLAHQLHFGRTAEELGLSQPVVSQELRRLEDMLPGVLFSRSTRLVQLTELGAALLPVAETIVAAADDMALVARQHQAERKTVTVACSPSIVDRLFPLLLRSAEERAPGLTIRELPVETGGVEDAMPGADLGIGRFLTDRPGFLVERLGSERLLALLSTTHPAAAAASVELARLGDLPLLIWSRSQAPAYYDELLRICRERGLEPQLVTAPPRITGVRSYLIADGRTFSLIPESATLRLSPGVCARPLSVPATVPVAATWRQSATARPELRTVLVLLRAAVREFAVS